MRAFTCIYEVCTQSSPPDTLINCTTMLSLRMNSPRGSGSWSCLQTEYCHYIKCLIRISFGWMVSWAGRQVKEQLAILSVRCSCRHLQLQLHIWNMLHICFIYHIWNMIIEKVCHREMFLYDMAQGGAWLWPWPCNVVWVVYMFLLLSTVCNFIFS